MYAFVEESLAYSARSGIQNYVLCIQLTIVSITKKSGLAEAETTTALVV